MTGMKRRKEEKKKIMKKCKKRKNDNGCRYGGTPAPNVWGVFLFSFPHLIVSWFVYACQPVGVSCFYAVSMYAMSPDSGVRFCWCCCFCVMMLRYGVDSVCSVANGLALMVVVLDMVVLFIMDGYGFVV